MNKKALFSILIIALVLVSLNAYSRECPQNITPKIWLESREELFEGRNYYKKILMHPVQILSFIELNSSMRGFSIDEDTGEINFTPGYNDLGIHKILFYAIDSSECYSSKLVTFHVYDKPKIFPLKPKSEYVTLSEGQSILFVVDVEDEDDDVEEYAWYINSQRQKGSLKEKFPFTTDYDSAGFYNVTLVVRDAKGLNDSKEWKVNVKESNRPPYLFSGLPDYAVESGGLIITDSMDSYFGDPDKDILKYSVTATDEKGNKIDIGVSISGDNELKITAPKDFTGVIIVEITAKDSFGESVKSNRFSLTVFGTQNDIDYSTIKLHVCGDRVCGGNETCSTCESDCGPCYPDQERCFSDYECTKWSKCILPGFIVRECADINRCYDQSGIPRTVQECSKVESCLDRKSTRLNSSHTDISRMPSSA